MAAPTTTLATISATLAASARTSAGNGKLVFGFVAAVDPGLPREQYVVVPPDAVLSDFTEVQDPTVGGATIDRFVECLLYDAPVVAEKDIPEDLKPFAAANRAYSYALGWLGRESVVAGKTLSTEEREAYVNRYPHLRKAVDLNLQAATYCSFVTGVCFYASNHNTTGSILPKGFHKPVNTFLGTTATPKQITDAVYFGGHASDKRLVLRSILPRHMVDQLVTPKVYNPCAVVETDAWATLRVGQDLLPAGTGILNTLKVLLNDVAECGLIGLAPAPEAVDCLARAAARVKANAGAYHPGARFLFNSDPIALAEVANLKKYFQIFGSFCMAAQRCPTVTSAPHLQALILEGRSAAWEAAGRTLAKGAIISEQSVAAAAMSMGVVLNAQIADPVVDPDGYAIAASRLRDYLRSIDTHSVPEEYEEEFKDDEHFGEEERFTSSATVARTETVSAPAPASPPAGSEAQA